MLLPATAWAQDLFELEVFEYDAVSPADYEIAFHTNVMSNGGVTASSPRSDHRPAHISVEVTRGWTERLDTAVFLQTAPFGSSGSARFAGGHIRGRFRFGELPKFPVRLAASAEYAFNDAAFDADLQTLELRAIAAYSRGRLSIVANPTLEIVTHGDVGEAPVLDLSARGAWALARRVTIAADYFSAAATTRHLQPEPEAHHLVFGGTDIRVTGAWEVGFSAGHCITSAEPWVLRSTVAYTF